MLVQLFLYPFLCWTLRFGVFEVDAMAGLFFFFGMVFALVGVRQVFKVFTDMVLIPFGFAPPSSGVSFSVQAGFATCSLLSSLAWCSRPSWC